MGYLYLYASAIARLVWAFGTTMHHVLQHLEGVLYQIVTLLATHMGKQTNATGIVFILAIVKSLHFEL